MQTAEHPGVNRRHFLKHLAGMSLWSLPGMQFVQQLRAAAPALKKENKSLVILWMNGGPSHMDTWDLKPGATTGGEFKPIKTSAPGVEICEHLPTVASQMKHLSIVRSLVTNEGSHERGRYLMHTGRTPNPIVTFPSIGSVASMQLTPKELALPGFISIGAPAQGPGFLGMNYAPFTVQNPGQPPANIKAPDSLGSDDYRVRRRQQLFYTLEEDFEKARGEAAKSHREIYQKAFSLVASSEGKVFDLRNEKTSTIEEYCGTGPMSANNNFGRGVLLARKLVEAGVTCVEVDLGSWDNHQNIFNILKNQHLPRLDRAMGALVKDLVDRGMWKNTVVVWMGEFGRTPRINQNTGRDHWPKMSVVVGGGAIKGGIAYGATSKDGMDVTDNQCTVSDLFATIYKGMGIDAGSTQIRDPLGRPHNLADNGKPIAALV